MSALTAAIAAYDAALMAEDASPHGDDEIRWQLGRVIYRTKIETAADAVALVLRLDAERDLPDGIGAELVAMISAGVTPADLPTLRRIIASVRASVAADAEAGHWTEQAANGLASLAAFLFTPRLASVSASPAT